LNNLQGIDELGHAIESSVFSPNPNYYGQFGFHNEGHVLLALIENPRNETNLPPGVMLEVATAMRDPIFYTYHTSMNNIFDEYKQTLEPYQPIGVRNEVHSLYQFRNIDYLSFCSAVQGELPLTWDGIEVTGFQVISDNGGHPNSLSTFMNQRNFELSRGLDFNRSGIQGALQACVHHLDHVGFTYHIDVVSLSSSLLKLFL
jgi:tyrosinase